VLHRDHKSEVVFDGITAIVFNTSHHNGRFFPREEARQTQ
jgi:hypothetical protein